MTDKQWKQVGTIFKHIHQVRLPPVGFESLRKETFDPREYIRWVRAFETQQAQAEGTGAARRALQTCWMAHQSTIHTVLTSLEKLAGVLRSRTLPFVICHADLHARNLIRDRAGQVFVIDWDEVMLASKERDFIFIRPPHTAAFFQGYGQAEIDWGALTYFLWERVVQDLIECTRNVWFREDWGEESRMEALQLLEVILAEDSGHIEAAYWKSALLGFQSHSLWRDLCLYPSTSVPHRRHPFQNRSHLPNHCPHSKNFISICESWLVRGSDRTPRSVRELVPSAPFYSVLRLLVVLIEPIRYTHANVKSADSTDSRHPVPSLYMRR